MRALKPTRLKAGRAVSKIPFPVVGIGGSAGGLEAFRKLLKNLSADLGMAFVFIMHLSPKYKSMLTELLSKETKMPVNEVKSGMVLQINQVYVIPPNTKMAMAGGKLILEGLKETDLKRLPIDYFFHSLAKEQGNRAIGVILSGTAADGTLGAEAIKGEGGIIFAQDEKSAKYDGMPQSAINAGCVDFVLSPEKIAGELKQIAKHPHMLHGKPVKAGESSLTQSKSLESVFDILRQDKDVDFTYYNGSTIRRRIARRMILLKLNSIKDYIKFLRNNKDEVDSLYQDLLINVTKFFREPEVFETLKKLVFPAILKNKKKGQGIKIWIPGCSEGEEVYSIAICILEVLGKKIGAVPVQIFASDVRESSIDKARRGLYGKHIEDDLTPERLKRFFTKDGNSYKVSRQLREICVFSRQNVFADPPLSNLDLISCRNLLIYLQPVLQKNVFHKFHYALRPGGFLILGNSESPGRHPNLFKALDGKRRIFVKKYLPTRPEPDFSRKYFEPAKLENKENLEIKQDKKTALENIVEQIVLNEYAACGALINANMDVVQCRGPIGHYLELAAGKPSHNIFKLVRAGLFMPLRSAIYQARKTKQTVKRVVEDVKYRTDSLRVNLTVIPVKSGPFKEEFFLVLFEETNKGVPAGNSAKGRGRISLKGKSVNNEESIKILHKELAETKEYLQTGIDEQERTNEEMKTANEEILSSNEELQSTNEELETAKEELRSANDELLIANEELRNSNAESLQWNNDLVNLLSSIKMPVIMMGTDLVIRWITPQTEKALNIISSDIGRPITKVKFNIKIPDLETMLLDVLDSVHSKIVEIKSRTGSWYSIYIRPYRTADNKIDGVVMVFVDITERKQAENALSESEEKFRSMAENLADVIFITDIKGVITYISPAASTVFGYAPEEMQGHFFGEYMDREEQLKAFAALEETAFTGVPTKTVILSARHRNGRGFYAELKAMVVKKEDAIKGAIGIIRDVTERKRLEEELIRMHKLDSLGVLAGGIAHDFNNILTGVLGNISMVRCSLDPTDKTAEILNEAEKAAFQAKNLTHQLLTFAKGGAPVKKPTVLADLLSESAVFATRGSKTKCLIRCAPDLCPVNVDPGQISQVVSNIVINAVQAMPEGGEISITAENIVLLEQSPIPLKAGPYIQVIIKDYGVGIPKEHLEKIFDPYFSTKRTGSGLGLATTYSIIKNHEGYITVESEIGKGSSFTFYLPAFAGETGTIQSSTNGKEIKKGCGRILVMEDEQMICRLLTRILARLGYQADCVADGDQALARYRAAWGTAEAFDAVILDLTIPGGKGGQETISALKKINPEIKAIVSSGYSNDSIMANYQYHGFSAVLSKPFSLEEISNVLSQLLT